MVSLSFTFSFEIIPTTTHYFVVGSICDEIIIELIKPKSTPNLSQRTTRYIITQL